MASMLLSRSYRPSVALAPYIARYYVFTAALPDDFELVDRVLSETAFVSILLSGDWAAETAPGRWHRAPQAVFFGPNGIPLTVRCRGAFHVVGLAIRPSGWSALFGCPASAVADFMLPLADLWDEDLAARLLAHTQRARDDHAIVAAAEAVVAAVLARRGRPRINEAMRVFEQVARNDSTARVHDVALRLHISERQFERHCLASFGHMPKTVLRRSRFLDMATVMRGMADPGDADLATLRYFDQSHLNREFRRFIAMTPSAFVRTATPLFDAGLELRQEHKAEARVPDTDYRVLAGRVA